MEHPQNFDPAVNDSTQHDTIGKYDAYTNFFLDPVDLNVAFDESFHNTHGNILEDLRPSLRHEEQAYRSPDCFSIPNYAVSPTLDASAHQSEHAHEDSIMDKLVTSSAPITPRGDIIYQPQPLFRTRSRSHPTTDTYEEAVIAHSLWDQGKESPQTSIQPHQTIHNPYGGVAPNTVLPANSSIQNNNTILDDSRQPFVVDPELLKRNFRHSWMNQSNRRRSSNTNMQRLTIQTSNIFQPLTSSVEVSSSSPMSADPTTSWRGRRSSPQEEANISDSTAQKTRTLTIRKGKYKRTNKVRGYEKLVTEFKFN